MRIIFTVLPLMLCKARENKKASARERRFIAVNRQKQRNDIIIRNNEGALSDCHGQIGAELWPLSDEEDRLMRQCGDHGAGIGASSMGAS